MINYEIIVESHQELNKEDKDYLLNIIYKTLFNNPKHEIVLTMLDKSGIGRFAQSFNKDIDLLVQNRYTDILTNIFLNGDIDMFIEIFDNSFLNETQKEELILLFNYYVEKSKGINLINRELNYCNHPLYLVNEGKWEKHDSFEIVTNFPKNPLTKTSFCKETIKRLYLKFEKEIAMVDRYTLECKKLSLK